MAAQAGTRPAISILGSNCFLLYQPLPKVEGTE